MRTAIFGTTAAIFIAVLISSCSKGTDGGPGATPKSEKSTTSVIPSTQGKDTFSLDVPNMATKLKRGEAKANSITVKRGSTMTGEVSITFENLPNGVTIEPEKLMVVGDDNEAKFTIKASNEAPVGDFTIKVVGHPKTGPDATNEFKVAVSEQ